MCNVDIKKIIKEHRLKAGLTMKELADLVGVSEATVSRWESGNIASMKHSQIAKLCRALNLNPASLVPGINAPAPEIDIDPLVLEIAQMIKERPAARNLFNTTKKATDKELIIAANLLDQLSAPDGN